MSTAARLITFAAVVISMEPTAAGVRSVHAAGSPVSNSELHLSSLTATNVPQGLFAGLQASTVGLITQASCTAATPSGGVYVQPGEQ